MTAKSKLHLATLEWAAAGYRVFPCYPNSKSPLLTDNLVQATTNPAHIDNWWTSWPDANIAVMPPDSITIIDIDVKNGAEGEQQWRDLGGDGFPTYQVTTPSGGKHLYYKGDMPSSNGKVAKHIDTRGNDGKFYIMVPPSIVAGVPYQAPYEGPPDDFDIAPLPPFLVNWTYDHPVSEVEPDQIARNLAQLLEAIEHIPNDDLTWAEWNDVGMAIWAATEGSEEGETAWHRFSERSNKYDTSETDERWSHYEDSPPTSIGAGSIYHWAGEAGWKHKTDWSTFVANIASGEIPQSTDGVHLKSGADSKLKRVAWLWTGHYARGKLHLRAGSPEVGKNVTAIDTAAVLSRGGLWPDGSAAPIGDTLVWSGEDNWEDTTLPRFVAAGGDVNHIFCIADVQEGDRKRTFDPARDVEELCKTLRRPGRKWAYVLIDPISVVVGTAHGASHNDAETRRALQPLVDLADELGIVVEGIIHYAKGSAGRSVLERVIGATAFGAVARVVHAVCKLKDSRRFVRVKCNIAKPGGAIGYEFKLNGAPVVDDDLEFLGDYPRVVWGEALEGDPEELLSEPKENPIDTLLMGAKAWLLERIAEAGEDGILAEDLNHLARDISGFSPITITRAKTAIGPQGDRSAVHFQRWNKTKPQWFWKSTEASREF